AEFSTDRRGLARAARAGAGAAAGGEAEVGVAATPGAGMQRQAGDRGGGACQVYGVLACDGLGWVDGLRHGEVLTACVPCMFLYTRLSTSGRCNLYVFGSMLRWCQPDPAV